MRNLYIAVIAALFAASPFMADAQIVEYDIQFNDFGGGDCGDCVFCGDPDNNFRSRWSDNNTGTWWQITRGGDNTDCGWQNYGDVNMVVNRTTTDPYITQQGDFFEDDGGGWGSWIGDDDGACQGMGTMYADHIIDMHGPSTSFTTRTTSRTCEGVTWYVSWRSRYQYVDGNNWGSRRLYPNNSKQNAGITSGRVNVWAVYLECGQDYWFSTADYGVQPQQGNNNFQGIIDSRDTYLRLYGTNGYTLVDSDDDSPGSLQSEIIYTPSSSGWYYIELSKFSRQATNFGGNMEYMRLDKDNGTATPSCDFNSTTLDGSYGYIELDVSNGTSYHIESCTNNSGVNTRLIGYSSLDFCGTPLFDHSGSNNLCAGDDHYDEWVSNTNGSIYVRVIPESGGNTSTVVTYATIDNNPNGTGPNNTTWTGYWSNDWHDNRNWTNCIPGSNTITTIPNASNDPVIYAGNQGDVETITIETSNGANLTIETDQGADLEVHD